MIGRGRVAFAKVVFEENASGSARRTDEHGHGWIGLVRPSRPLSNERPADYVLISAVELIRFVKPPRQA
jgi:hypothetical protein